MRPTGFFGLLKNVPDKITTPQDPAIPHLPIKKLSGLQQTDPHQIVPPPHGHAVIDEQ